jgi:opacity protein-like surface antigen
MRTFTRVLFAVAGALLLAERAHSEPYVGLGGGVTLDHISDTAKGAYELRAGYRFGSTVELELSAFHTTSNEERTNCTVNARYLPVTWGAVQPYMQAGIGAGIISHGGGTGAGLGWRAAAGLQYTWKSVVFADAQAGYSSTWGQGNSYATLTLGVRFK